MMRIFTKILVKLSFLIIFYFLIKFPFHLQILLYLLELLISLIHHPLDNLQHFQNLKKIIYFIILNINLLYIIHMIQHINMEFILLINRVYYLDIWMLIFFFLHHLYNKHTHNHF